MNVGSVNVRLGRRTALVSLVATAGVAVCAGASVASGLPLGGALAALGAADPRWLALACVGFAGSIFCSAQSWRTATAALGGTVGRADATARFSVGALVNAVAPAKLGEAVRVALFAQVLTGGGRGWSAAGLFGAIGVARAVVIALGVVAASATGALPLWPVFVLVGAGAAIVGGACVVRRRGARGKLASLLDALAVFVDAPGASARVLAWTVGVSLARLAAAAATAAALGVPSPLVAALVIVPALDVAGTLPLTPGSLGVASGAVALALRAHRIGAETALSTGIAFNGAEIVVGALCGICGLVALGGRPRLAPRAALASA